MYYANDFRDIARRALNGRWALAVGTGFVAALLGVNAIAFRAPDLQWREKLENMDLHLLLPFVASVLYFTTVYALIVFFLGGAVQLGYCRFNRNLIDNNNPQFMDLFSSFHIFWKGFLMKLLVTIYIILWTLLFIIPGIIAEYSYAMTPYILEENPGMGINEAISCSKDMMRGNKWRLFCLNISFIGWGFLCLFTCGIGFLWLGPYVNAAHAAFFYDVSGKFTYNNQYNSGNTGYYTGNM
jgi:Predicted integral membrane protein